MPTAGPNTTEVLRWIFDESKLDEEEEAIYAITLVERSLLALLQKLPNSAVGARYLAQNQPLVHVITGWKLRSHIDQTPDRSTGLSKIAKRKRAADRSYKPTRSRRTKKVKATEPSATDDESGQNTAKGVSMARMSSVPLVATHKLSQNTETNISVRQSQSEPLADIGTVGNDGDGGVAARGGSTRPSAESERSTHDIGGVVSAQRRLNELDACKIFGDLSLTVPARRAGGASYDDRPDANAAQLYNPSRLGSTEPDEAEGDDEWVSGDPGLEEEPVDALNDEEPLVADRSQWDASKRDMIVRRTCQDLAAWTGYTNARLESICEPHLIVARDDDGLTANVRMIQLPEIAERITQMEAMQHTMECFVRLNWVGLNIWVEFRKIQLGTEGIRNGVLTKIRDELIAYTLARERMSNERGPLSVRKQWQRRLRASRRWAQLYGHFGAGILLLPRMVFDCRNFGDVSNAEFEQAFADWKQNEDLEELVEQLGSHAARLFSEPTTNGNEDLVERLRVTYASDGLNTVQADRINAEVPSEI